MSQNERTLEELVARLNRFSSDLHVKEQKPHWLEELDLDGYRGKVSLNDSLKGKRITGVSHDSRSVTFQTDRGCVRWVVTADCCSESWIEHTDFALVEGLVLAVRKVELPASWYVAHRGPPQEDHLELYGVVIETEKGTGTIDFRNESNGYYGGSMEVAP